jgi:(1->4)-alpha-D-glucan 1-alpha-D-glucosylmutase
VRARLNVLSELPGAWKQATARWARANRRGRSTIDGQSFPSRNDEYLLYQTLLGTWPLAPLSSDEERAYRDRIVAYMHKAMREAKVFTSWINPSERHERAIERFIDTALALDNVAFRHDFLDFQRRVATYGAYNSLAQLAVKIGAPGVPDLYQGAELWDFSLVDPDNRRRVDYARRRELLAELDARLRTLGASGSEADTQDRAAWLAGLASRPYDDRLKLYTTMTLLRFRRAHQELFRYGGYEALTAAGSRREHLFAFSRAHASERVLVIVPRLIATLLPDADVPPLGERVWGDTRLVLPPDAPAAYRNIFSGQCVTACSHDERLSIPAAEIFGCFPVAVLEVR